MAAQGKVFHGLCRSLWRVNVSGTTEHGHLLGGSASFRCLRQVSSTSQHLPTPTFMTTSLPLCLQSPSPTVSVSQLRVKAAGSGVRGTGLHPLRKADGVSAVSAQLAGLGLHRQGGSACGSLREGQLAEGQLGEGHLAEGQLTERQLAELVGYSPDVRSRVSWKTKHSLASWPDRQHQEYVCPSQTLTSLPQLVILEQLPDTTPYHLPHTPTSVSITDPTSSHSTEISEPADNTNTPKEARQILKIRRKKMKRHLLKKFRKRMAFTLRKIKRDRKKKKEAVFQARLASIRQWGDNFSATDWVQDQLDRARKGGFYINVLDKKQ